MTRLLKEMEAYQNEYEDFIKITWLFEDIPREMEASVWAFI
jgi:hypothetical protein